MKIDLVPYAPAHPKAPKFSKKTKVVKANNIGKMEPKVMRSVDAHRRFRSAHKACKYKDSELTTILKAFNQNLMQAALESRAGVTLPNRMGKLEVITVKLGKRKRINKQMSEELGVTVHLKKLRSTVPVINLDINTDSYNMPNKYLWEFGAFARHKKTVWGMYEENRTYFAPAKKDLAMRWRKDKFYKKEFAMRQSAELLLTYNEFEGIV